MSIQFDRAADYYDRTRGYPPGVDERIGQALLEAAGATPETRLLELGIGTGRIALPIIRAGYRYTGIDLSPRMLEKLRAALHAIPGAEERVTLVEGDITALPFPDGRFDAVVSVHVYHLVADLPRALTESVRVLARPGVVLTGRDTNWDDERRAVYAAWHDILRDLGYDPARAQRHAATLTLAEEWQRLGGAVDEVVAAEWVIFSSPAQDVEGIAERLYSSTWPVPDEIYPESVRRLRAWAAMHYGDALNTPIRRPRRFIVERARFNK